MRYLLWILLIFSVAVALVLASHNPGYVLLVYPPYRIELSLTLFLLVILAGFVSAYMLIRLSVAVVRLPATVREFRRARTQSRLRKAHEEALAAFFAGSFAQAEQRAVLAMRDGDESPLLAVVAARSAHEQHAHARRDSYMEALRGKAGEAGALHLLTEGRFLLDRKAAGAVLAILPSLYDMAGKNHAGALALELKARQMAGDWARVLALLAQMEKRALLDGEVAARLREQAWLGQLRLQATPEALNACLGNMPAEIRRQKKIVEVAASILIRLGQCEAASHLLAETLETNWESDLAGLYGECATDGEDSLARIAQAEKWLTQHQDDARLLLALGKLCMQRQLWGKAQNYLEASLSVLPSREAYTALARLFQETQRPDLAAQNFQRAAAFH